MLPMIRTSRSVFHSLANSSQNEYCFSQPLPSALKIVWMEQILDALSVRDDLLLKERLEAEKTKQKQNLLERCVKWQDLRRSQRSAGSTEDMPPFIKLNVAATSEADENRAIELLVKEWDFVDLNGRWAVFSVSVSLSP